MTSAEVIRTAAWLVPLALTYALAIVRGPTPRVVTAVGLGIAWNAWAVLAVNVLAVQLGWWTYDPGAATFMGVSIELWFGWALLWGGVVPLFASDRPLVPILLAAFWVDLIAIPALSDIVGLGDAWLLGEVMALTIAFMPGLLLFRWTLERRRVKARTVLQIICAGGVFLWLLPSLGLEQGPGWNYVLETSPWQTGVAIQMLLLPVAVGTRAALEFAERGRGTPLPFDPPTQLVTSGPYAYVRNPMQLSLVLIFLFASAFLARWWILTGAIFVVLYSFGLAAWHEHMQLADRFGTAWTEYRRQVRSWVPTLRPRVQTESILLVAYSCVGCSAVGRWILARRPTGLVIAPAEEWDGPPLSRLTYVPADGPHAQGVVAFARALEHLHLGWAVVGWTVMLPGVAQSVQLLADVFGPTPHVVSGLPYDVRACELDSVPAP